jgi:cell wall-associated NlpC family hydrolase
VSTASFAAPGAHASPGLPPNASDALKNYVEVSEKAEQLNEEHLKAQDQLKTQQELLDKATSDLDQAGQVEEQAKADEEKFRGQVDLLTEASFEGARFNHLSALLVSDSQQDFLNRMSALGVLAADNSEALGKLSGAVATADQARTGAQDAQGRANAAIDAANKAITDIDQRKSELDGQITTARAAFSKLSSAERNLLADKGDMSVIPTPAGAAGQALKFALAQRGKDYVFGSNGPNTWDCSSLMQASYREAGIAIPRTTYGQATVGVSVSRNDVRAGDMIIYYSGQSHVAMAIDNIRAVHASTEGVPVRIALIEDIGPISVIRRVVG